MGGAAASAALVNLVDSIGAGVPIRALTERRWYGTLGPAIRGHPRPARRPRGEGACCTPRQGDIGHAHMTACIEHLIDLPEHIQPASQGSRAG